MQPGNGGDGEASGTRSSRSPASSTRLQLPIPGLGQAPPIALGMGIPGMAGGRTPLRTWTRGCRERTPVPAVPAAPGQLWPALAGPNAAGISVARGQPGVREGGRKSGPGHSS